MDGLLQDATAPQFLEGFTSKTDFYLLKRALLSQYTGVNKGLHQEGGLREEDLAAEEEACGLAS